MHPPNPGNAAFKRQVVFRIGADDWPLLEAAALEHGSIQAAVLAGLYALQRPAPAKSPTAEPVTEAAPSRKNQPTVRAAAPPTATPPELHEAAEDPREEIRAREAAKILGLKTGTVSGYIRSGRLPGRYDDSPTWLGWLTTRGAVADYAKRTRP